MTPKRTLPSVGLRRRRPVGSRRGSGDARTLRAGLVRADPHGAATSRQRSRRVTGVDVPGKSHNRWESQLDGGRAQRRPLLLARDPFDAIFLCVNDIICLDYGYVDEGPAHLHQSPTIPQTTIFFQLTSAPDLTDTTRRSRDDDFFFLAHSTSRGWNSHDTLGLDCDAEWVKTPRRVRAFPCSKKSQSKEKEEEEDGGGDDDDHDDKSGGVPDAAKGGVKQGTLGGWHALAVDVAGQTYAWGGNEYGQAGVDCGTAGNGVHVSLHLSVPAAVLQFTRVKQVACGGMNAFAVVEHSGEVYQWGQTVGSEKEPARAPAKVAVAHGVVMIAAGSFHALALQEDGRVLSWGNGDYGQLGLGRPGNENSPRVVEALSRAGVASVAAGGWHSAAITAGRVCYIWGRGEYGRLGLGNDCTDKPRPVELSHMSQRIVQAALGGTHTLLLDESGTVVSFGRNNHGRLGRVADGRWTGVPGQVVFPPPPGGGRWRCTSVAAGGRHNMATAVPVGREEEAAERMAGGGLHQNNHHNPHGGSSHAVGMASHVGVPSPRSPGKQ